MDHNNIHVIKKNNQLDATIGSLLKFQSYFDMFQAIVMPIFRSIRSKNRACGMKHLICCLPLAWMQMDDSPSASKPMAGNI
jgi:hypothetical protein